MSDTRGDVPEGATVTGASTVSDTDDLSSLRYEELVEELERTIDRMASGDIGIEEVTELYERAGRLHALAAERLARISERIEGLAGGSGGRGGAPD